jgi:hypothetical protein
MLFLISYHEHHEHLIICFFFLLSQFVQLDYPLENITTAEAIRKLIQHYNHSQQYYNAKQRVDDISRIVSTCTGLLALYDMSAKTLLINHICYFIHSERNSLGSRRKPGQLLHAGFYTNQALLC